MRSTLIMLCATMTALLLWVGPVRGAVDMFLKIEGVEGEASDPELRGWIEVESFSWGASNPVSIGDRGTGAGKVSFRDLSLGKRLDIVSPQLFLRVASGKHFPGAQLVMRSTGDQPFTFFQMDMTEVYVSGIQMESSEDDEEKRVSEEVSLNFARVKVTYTPQEEDGGAGDSVSTGWDIKANEEI